MRATSRAFQPLRCLPAAESRTVKNTFSRTPMSSPLAGNENMHFLGVMSKDRKSKARQSCRSTHRVGEVTDQTWKSGEAPVGGWGSGDDKNRFDSNGWLIGLVIFIILMMLLGCPSWVAPGGKCSTAYL